MAEEVRMKNILDEIKRNFEDLSSRKSTTIANSQSTIESIVDDIIVIPDYIVSLNSSHQELQQTNTDLEQQIMTTTQAVETTSAEIDISETKRSELEINAERKRDSKQELETKIVELQGKKTELETELDHVTNTAAYKEQEYTQLEANSKQEIAAMDAKILENNSRLELAKEENKLIVYLMDAGLLDVPEAEVVSVIASNPNGLTLAEIKDKVSMPPVRIQPTINTLLEKVLEYVAHSDSYKILESIKGELG